MGGDGRCAGTPGRRARDGLQKAVGNVYVRAGKSRGTSMVVTMMESMDLQPIHFSRIYSSLWRLTFRGVPYPPPSLSTMMDKIEVVLQLMELVDDGMKDRH